MYSGDGQGCASSVTEGVHDGSWLMCVRVSPTGPKVGVGAHHAHDQ